MHSVEKWRYRCPRGHTGWEFTGRSFWCPECYRRAEGETGRFERLHDQKTDELLEAGEFRSRIETG